MDNEAHQNTRDVLFSKYSIICLDEKSLPWFEENLNKFSELAYILFFNERDDTLEVLQHIIEASTLEGKKIIKILHISKIPQDFP